MAPLRAPLQGVGNVVRFNWPFYALAGLALATLLVAGPLLPGPARPYALGGAALALLPLVASLGASYYVYDRSSLYHLDWLPWARQASAPATLLTLSAGFDELTPLLQAKRWPTRQLTFDFYDPARHTEASIRRARAAYPPPPGTQAVTTNHLALADATVEAAVAFLSAHEIRDAAERVAFFRELGRVVQPGGPIVVVEHLRDPANFLAYTIGFLHFHSRRSWLATFVAAGLHLEREVKITPFISAFTLYRHAGAA